MGIKPSTRINYLTAQENGFLPNLDEIYEIKFENEIGNAIYYTGPYIGIGIQAGVGEYWIYENNIKKIVLEIFSERRPEILWHTEYLAEIVLQFAGEKGYGDYSCFFDFRDNVISQAYYFPMYVDIKNNYLITLGEEGLNVYNIKTNELIREYKQDGIFEGVQSFKYYYFNYKISVENNRLIFSYDYYTAFDEIHESIEFEYNY
jgi:hypothetical protein